MAPSIRLLLADVDGTLVTQDKVLTDRAIAAFNGGVYVHPDMSVIQQQVIPDDVTPTVIDLLAAHNLDVWIYRGSDWFLRDPKAPHVARESSTVKFGPTVTGNF